MLSRKVSHDIREKLSKRKEMFTLDKWNKPHDSTFCMHRLYHSLLPQIPDLELHFFRLGESQINLHGRLPPTIGTKMFVLYEDDYADLHDLVTAACAPLPAERSRGDSSRAISVDDKSLPALRHRRGSSSTRSSRAGSRARSNSSTGEGQYSTPPCFSFLFPSLNSSFVHCLHSATIPSFLTWLSR